MGGAQQLRSPRQVLAWRGLLSCRLRIKGSLIGDKLVLHSQGLRATTPASASSRGSARPPNQSAPLLTQSGQVHTELDFNPEVTRSFKNLLKLWFWPWPGPGKPKHTHPRVRWSQQLQRTRWTALLSESLCLEKAPAPTPSSHARPTSTVFGPGLWLGFGVAKESARPRGASSPCGLLPFHLFLNKKESYGSSS